ncbi:MAG: universal stress protein [Mycobacterium sp.]|nr:universal stress protein [Mycobacterium sp.]
MANRVSTGGFVVGVDGSHGSDAAVRWAAAEAGLRNVALTVVHVMQSPIGGLGGWGFTMAPLPEDFFQWQESAGRRIIADAVRVAKEAIGDSANISVRGEVFYSPLVPTLVDLTKDARLLVVGCQGQGGLQRVLLGSVSTALVHHAHCPVAVIHEEAAAGPQAPVVVGIDGSPASELATAIAFDEASWRGVELVALHAWSDADMSEFPGAQWSVAGPAAEEELAERLAGWQERYPDVRVRRVVFLDQPARHLLAEAEKAQLMVVGSHGRGGFAGMLLGSVSTAVVHGVRTPVIVARQR